MTQMPMDRLPLYPHCLFHSRSSSGVTSLKPEGTLEPSWKASDPVQAFLFIAKETEDQKLKSF